MSCEPKSYDVFLSLGGKDVRYTFTGNLFNALRSKRIKTLFREHEYEPHETNISPSALKAIQTSKISIVVFSPEYASSSRRLDELLAILECRMRTNQLVWPIFYGVEPTDVRFQRGRYEQAMNRFEERYSPERMNKWRSALAEVSNLSGWFYQKEYDYFHELICTGTS